MQKALHRDLEPTSTRPAGGVVAVFAASFRDSWRYRELIGRFAARDIKVRYRQSFLGYFWAIFPALVTVVISTWLASLRALPIGPTPIPYPAYVIWGLTVWQLFSGCVVGTTQSLASAGRMVANVAFPKETLVLASLAQPIVDFLLRLIPVVALMFWYGVSLRPALLLLPLLLLPIVALALAVGLVLSIANLVARDVSNALTVVLSFGIFLTPVFYPPPTTAPFALVNSLNPLSPLLAATHDLLAVGMIRSSDHFASSVGLSVLLLAAALYFFRLALPRVLERA